MNRIYQGRVAAVECPNPDPTSQKANHWVPLDADPKGARQTGDDALWAHHVLFQDAVNYYIVALASLGHSAESKLTKLRELLGPVWERFDKKGERRSGMGESLQRAWQLPNPPTLLEAVERFQQPIIEGGVPMTTAEKAGEFLLFNLGGDAAIQQGGPVFFPMFCDPDSNPTYRLSVERRGRADAEEKLRIELHRDLSEKEIHQLAASITLGAVVNLQPGEAPDTGAAAVPRIQEAAATFRDRVSEQQLEDWLRELPPTFALAKNRGGNINKPRVHACVLFLAFPNETTKELFQSTFPAPKAPRASGSKKGNTQTIREADEADFIVDGDDPIKLARGNRGMVFPGFTALPLWGSDGRKLQWKLFDIAAFKEALKVYNQFQQNVSKREAKLDALATKLLVMDGEKALETYTADTVPDRKIHTRLFRIWRETDGKPKPPASETGDESELPRFASDARIDRLRQIVNADLAEEYRLTDGRSTPYGLRRRTMKGWPDVKRRWQSIVRAGTAFSEETRKKLKAELDALRGGEKREQIGSHYLFEALLEDEEAWNIWREPDDALLELINKKNWATDPLEAFRNYCETRETLEQIDERPLNFTPADARYSRRLFIFTDACSFGKDRGEFRHDVGSLAVTVPMAWKDDSGHYSMQPRRIVYSAPRLLRDRIRGEDGSLVQDWNQPMMSALLGSAEPVNPQKLKDAAVQLMPDFDAKDRLRILLNFPLSLDDSALREKLGKAALWEAQFHSWKNGEQLPFLRWPEEFTGKEPHRWWEKTDRFTVLAADLGTRHAASVALVEADSEQHATSRSIGEAGERQWYARYRTGTILRLPGENARVFRPRSRLDRDEGDLAFREELYGERGRTASEDECRQTLAILEELGQLDLVRDASNPASLRKRFSFPQQNDKLLVALRRTQSWLASCVSWHWKLTNPERPEQTKSALAQLRDQQRVPKWQGLADEKSPDLQTLRTELRDHIIAQREMVQRRLLQVTGRVLPLRGRAWEWVPHPDKPSCHVLQQTAADSSTTSPLLSGQRGLSIARIEQLSELRRRWQSLNQALRRELGQKPLTASEMRNDPIPDPCRDILRKLKNIREQRVNQTAHLILAQALGLRLRQPQTPEETRTALDLHGEYERIPGRAPVDMIVLEDLSRYLSDQGRARSENTRLMKWCHRAVSQKVKMLAEPFGIPVLETPAAYSSRFCSLTGVAGFRAAEVGWNHRHEFRWRVLLEEADRAKTEGTEPSSNASYAAALFSRLESIDKSTQPHRTLLAPQPGGPIFLTAQPVARPRTSAVQNEASSVSPMQADLNAAANLAFRAIAHASRADIHHRVRTSRKPATKTKPETFTTREARRFGKEGVGIELKPGHSLPKERNSNLFFDPEHAAPFGRARLQSDSPNDYPYASGPGLWGTVNNRDFQWQRCDELNKARIAKWDRNFPEDDVPM